MTIPGCAHPTISGLRLDVLHDRILEPLRGRPLAETLPISGGDPDGLLAHSRFVADKQQITIRAVESEPTLHLVADIGEALFGGYLFAHYGHFLAESIHRLWPVLDSRRYDDLKIVFAVSSMHGGATRLKPHMIDVFSYLGIDAERIVLISEPLHVGRLHVAESARGLGRLPPPGYDDIFKRLGPSTEPAATTRLYVTRSRHLFSGGYLGELLVEEVLAASGIAVVVPEEHRAQDLMRLYRSAGHIAFSEGSAIHLVEMSGGLAAKVLVVGRREPAFVEERFIRMLSALCAEATQFACMSALAPFKIDAEGRVERSWSPVVVDIGALLERLADFYGIEIAAPSQQQISRAMLLDLGRFALDPRSSTGANAWQLGRQLKALQKQVGSKGLLDGIY